MHLLAVAPDHPFRPSKVNLKAAFPDALTDPVAAAGKAIVSYMQVDDRWACFFDESALLDFCRTKEDLQPLCWYLSQGLARLGVMGIEPYGRVSGRWQIMPQFVNDLMIHRIPPKVPKKEDAPKSASL